MRRILFALIFMAFASSLYSFEADFFPKKRARNASEIRIRFKKPIAPLGDPSFKYNPLESISCLKGEINGVWEEPSLFVYKFESSLPAGILCKVRLRPDIKSVDGDLYKGVREFEFDTDVVTVKNIYPYTYQNIRNEEIFIISFTGDIDIKKNLNRIFFRRSHTSESVEVTLLDEGDVQKLITTVYPYLKSAKQRFYGIRPKVRFADGENVELVLKNLESKDGISSNLEEKYTFRVMDSFKVEINCEREKAEKDCVPISEINVNFSTPVEIKNINDFYLTDESGKRINPQIPDRYDEIFNFISFSPPFYPNHTYTLHLPLGLKDIYDRIPTNVEKFPLKIKTDRMPPLAKFAADFGIVEMIDGEGVLPLTIRGLKKDLRIKSFAAEGGDSKLTYQPKRKGFLSRIWDFIKSLFVKEKKVVSDDRKYIMTDLKIKSVNLTDMMPQKIFELVNSINYSDYLESSFDNLRLEFEESRLSDISDFEESTVIGLPLKKFGLYFFEIESSVLGDYMISMEEKKNNQEKAYLHSVALVTDMGITFKWGKRNSLVFVTRLSDASPVNGAEIKIYDCKGNEYYSGLTNDNGVVYVENLPDRHLIPECYSDYRWGYYANKFNFLKSGLIVTARYKGDFSLVSSEWDKGIEPYRYNIYNYLYSADNIIHSVLSRNLLRSGETLHIKGYFRTKELKNINVGKREDMPRKIKIEHLGTGKIWEYDILWDENGTTFLKWDVPKDANTGHYKISYSDCPSDNKKGKNCSYESSSFIVEEFKVPLIKGEMIIKEAKSRKIPVEGVFSYLMGAPANDMAVTLRYKFSENFFCDDERYPKHRFCQGRVKSGIDKQNMGEYQEYDEYSEGEYQEGKTDAKNLWHLINLRTDEFGRFKTEIPIRISDSGVPLILDLEAGYTDPNGYFYTITKSENIYPSNIITGVYVSIEPKSGSLNATAVVLNKDKKVVKGETVIFNLYHDVRYAHRKKVLGGYYSYEYVREIKPLGEICRGVSDTDGKVECSKKIEKGGNYIVEVVSGDEKRGLSYSRYSTFMGYYEHDEWFDYSSDSDRTDISTDKNEYKLDEKIQVKVVTPFEKSTALVTVERGGILDYFVTELDSKRPIIELPVKPEYSPNVFISVVLIRGRVGSPPPTFFVDLAKPSLKMGYTRISVDKERYRLNVKISTDKQKYQVREKVKGRVEIKGAGGETTDLMLMVVDEGLLMLLDNPTYDILNGIIREEDCNVSTSSGLTQVVGKRHFGKKALPSGGGGGRIVTRELFDTLVYFNESLKVMDGKADFEFVLNDSITSFRIVAVAATKSKFGSSKHNIESVKELFINSSLPYFAREGDKYDAEFVIKNISDKEYNLKINGSVKFFLGDKEVSSQILNNQSIVVKAGGNNKVSFSVLVPESADEGRYNIEISSGNKILDSISIRQKIVESIPKRVVQSIFKRFKNSFSESYKALIDNKTRRRISMSFMKDIKETGSLLKKYRGFSFSCLEQKISYAVVADDKELFSKLMNEINLYQDENGFLKYYPTSKEGSPALTAYILEITHLAGFELPYYVITKAQTGLKNFIMGKIYQKNVYMQTTRNFERIFALSAVSSYISNAAELLGALRPDVALMPLSTLVDIGNIQGKNPEIYNAIMAHFTEKGGAYFLNKDDKNSLWWLMRSDDEAFAKTLIYLMKINADDTLIGKMANGLMNRFESGYLYNTTANAYAAVALRLFGKRYKIDIKNSNLKVGFNCNFYNEKIDRNFVSKSFIFDVLKDNSVLGGDMLPDCLKNEGDYLYSEDKNNEYWIKVLLEEEAPLTASVFKGFKIKKEYLDDKGMQKKEFRQSDLIKVRITVEPDSYYQNFVIIDPLITGAQVAGRITGSSSDYSDYYWDYTYSDVRDGFIRTYYEYVYSNKIVFEYSMRINSKGTFILPPTRVELMYMPDIYGEIPNDKIVIQ